MKQMIVLITMLTLISVCCTGPKTTASLPEDALRWGKDRQITWDDFHGQPIDDGYSGSGILIQLSTYYKNPSFFHKAGFIIDCYMDRRKSWVLKTQATNELLLYNQILFNIYELFARQLRHECSITEWDFRDPAPAFNIIYEKHNNSLNFTLQRFRSESKLGVDKSALNKWHSKIAESLSELDNFATK